MTKYRYIGKRKLTFNWNQYFAGETIELESLNGMNPNDFVVIEEPKKTALKVSKKEDEE